VIVAVPAGEVKRDIRAAKEARYIRAWLKEQTGGSYQPVGYKPSPFLALAKDLDAVGAWRAAADPTLGPVGLRTGLSIKNDVTVSLHSFYPYFFEHFEDRRFTSIKGTLQAILRDIGLVARICDTMHLANAGKLTDQSK